MRLLLFSFLLVVLTLGCTFQGQCFGTTCDVRIDFSAATTPTREVISTATLRPSATATKTPGATPVLKTATPQATATLNRQQVCNTTTGTYNVRSSPEVATNLVGSLLPGACVEADNPLIILQTGTTRWVQIFIDGSVAWVSAAAFGV